MTWIEFPILEVAQEILTTYKTTYLAAQFPKPGVGIPPNEISMTASNGIS